MLRAAAVILDKILSTKQLFMRIRKGRYTVDSEKLCETTHDYFTRISHVHMFAQQNYDNDIHRFESQLQASIKYCDLSSPLCSEAPNSMKRESFILNQSTSIQLDEAASD